RRYVDQILQEGLSIGISFQLVFDFHAEKAKEDRANYESRERCNDKIALFPGTPEDVVPPRPNYPDKCIVLQFPELLAAKFPRLQNSALAKSFQFVLNAIAVEILVLRKIGDGKRTLKSAGWRQMLHELRRKTLVRPAPGHHNANVSAED